MAKGGFTLDFTSLTHLAQRFDRFPGKLNAVTKQGLRDGAKLVRDAAKANVNIGPKKKNAKHPPGALRKSIKVRSAVRALKVFVTTSGSDNMFTGETYYGGMVEFGHAIGSRKKAKLTGFPRGQVPPHPFMSKAIDQKRQAAQTALERKWVWALHELENGP